MFFIVSIIAEYIPLFDEIYQVFDARHQYPGFYTELINRLKEGHLFFSFNGGLGFNFLGTLTYYLMSPLNILSIFFKAENLTYFFFIIIYIRIGLSGLTMAIYLNNQKENKQIWTIVFSVIFALMGFLSSYYYNFMWIDSIIMLPLILLGIDKIINKKNALLYIVSLSLAIIFNYYIGVIICIFSVIYFIYKILSAENNNYLTTIKLFIISSLICGLLASFILIPTYYALIVGKAEIYGSSWMNYFEFSKNTYSFFYKLTPASYQLGDQAYGPAMVYSTLLVLALVITFFYNKKFTLKEKIVVGSILLFYYLSFSINLLDYGWQLFQRPIWWQSRYSFTFSTFMIIIAYKNMVNIERLEIKNLTRIKIIGITSLIFVISAFFVFNDLDLSKLETSAYFFLAFSVLLFAQIIYLLGDQKLSWYFIALLSLELILNTYNNLEKTNFNNSYSSLKKEVISYKNPVEYIKSVDNDFYRMEFIKLHTTNDGMLFNYKGINFFNSTRNQNTMDFLEHKMNVDVDSGCGVKLKSYNPALMSLLNVKYLIGEIDYYPIINDQYPNIHQNPYPLGIGFMVNRNSLGLPLFDGLINRNLDNIFSAFIDKEVSFIKYLDSNIYIDEFENVTTSINGLKKQFSKKDQNKESYVALNYISDGDYLILPDEVFEDYSEILIDDKKYEKNSSNFIYLKKDQKLRVKYLIKDSSISEDAFYFHLFDLKIYSDTMQEINSFLEINKNSNHLLEGTVTVSKDRNVLFTTIPFEKGMIIKANGKIIKPVKIFDTFIGLELEPGEHLITFDYIPQGLKLGIFISSLTVISLISYYILKKREVI